MNNERLESSISEHPTSVSYKELFTAQIIGLRDQLHALERLVDERFNARDKALILQFTETLRRLDDLNHAHAQTRETQATYLPRELYEADKKEVRLWQVSTDKVLGQVAVNREEIARQSGLLVGLDDRVDKIEKENDNFRGRLWALGIVFTIVVILINLALRYL